MTDLAAPSAHKVNDTMAATALIVAGGALGGFVLGIAARAWMRLISDDPGFSWSGTLFIIGGFTVFGLTQSIVAVTRRRTRRCGPLTIARTVGIIGMLPLFFAAGAVMLPTVVAGGLAVVRVDWTRAIRWIFVLFASVPVIFVGRDLIDTFGWSLHATAGVVAMLGVYGVIIWATRFTFTAPPAAWRLPTWAKITIIVALALLVLRTTVGAGIQ